MRSARFWVVMLLLVGAFGLLRRRGDTDWVPVSTPLSGLPETIEGWTATDVPLNAAVLEVLGKGEFLNRVYTPVGAEGTPGSAGSMPAGGVVTLFIAYFPTQRTGQAIHSPQNCLPGAGWTFETKRVIDVADGGGRPFQVGEYLISDGRVKQEVLYWYRSHGRSMASDYAAKFYTLADSIRYNRTDAALIRIVTPLGAGEDQETAHVRAVRFAEGLAPMLPAYIPD